MSVCASSDPRPEDPIRVIARVKPPPSARAALAVVASAAHATLAAGGQTYAFDAVVEAGGSQEHVFELAARAISDNTLAGYNGTVFAYGQTGSGKTHTIYGPDGGGGGDADRGILPRTLEHVFAGMRAAEARGDGRVAYTCRASFLEIYNERIYDLLEGTSAGAGAGAAAGTGAGCAGSGASEEAGESLAIREHKVRGIYVEGLTEVAVAGPSEALALMLSGAKNRTVAATLMNRESSRSHSVFALVIEATERVSAGVTKSRVARFNLIDLAGSERQKLTQAAGERLKEAGQINKSLSALGGVIQSLVDISQGKSRHVPYRDSKLTMLLRDSLGGNSKTALIATVSATEDCLAETLSTLKFAQRAKLVRNKAVVNEDTTGSVAALQTEIKQLRAQLLEFRQMAPQAASTAGAQQPHIPAATTELYQLGDRILASWDTVLADVAALPVPASGAVQRAADFAALAISDGAPAAITRARAEGSQASGGVTALAALAHTHRKLTTMLGGANAASSATLRSATEAYERICDLEEKYSAAWAEREEADSRAEVLHTFLAGQLTAAQRLVDEQRLVAAAIEARWDALRDDSGAGSSDAGRSAPVAANPPATAAAPAKSAADGPAARTAAQSKLQAQGAAKPAAFVAARRPSVTAQSVAAPGPVAPPTTHASKLAQPGFKRRPSVDASVSAGTSSAPSSAAGSRRPSISSASAVDLHGSQLRRPSVSLGDSLAAAAAAAAAASTAAASGAPIRDEVQRLLEGLNAAVAASRQATATAAESELTELRAEVARLRSAAGACGAGTGPFVLLPRSTLQGLVYELSSLVSEVTGLREHVTERCDPAAWVKLKDERGEALQRMGEDMRNEMEREYEKIAEQRAALDVEAGQRASLEAEARDADSRAAELEAANCELQAELEVLRNQVQVSAQAAREAQVRAQEAGFRQANLEEDAASAAAEARRLRAEVDDALADAAARADASALAERQLRDARAELATSARDAASAAARVAELERCVKDAEELRSTALSEAASLRGELSRVATVLADLEARVAASELHASAAEHADRRAVSVAGEVPAVLRLSQPSPAHDDIAASMSRAFAALNAGLSSDGGPPLAQAPAPAALAPSAAPRNPLGPVPGNSAISVNPLAKSVQQQFAAAAAARVASRRGE